MFVILSGSQLEEYKRKSLVGHWVLVAESFEDLQKENDNSSKQVGTYNFYSINLSVTLLSH